MNFRAFQVLIQTKLHESVQNASKEKVNTRNVCIYIVHNRHTDHILSLHQAHYFECTEQKKCNILCNFLLQINPEAGEPFHLALFLPAIQQTKLSTGHRQTSQLQSSVESLLRKHRARATALECLAEAIQRHHSLSVQTANTNVKDVTLHGSPI